MENIHCRNCPVLEISLLKECRSHNLEHILSIKKPVSWQQGEFLFREGHWISYLYCLYSGNIRIEKTDKKGKIQTIRHAKAGDMIELKTIPDQPRNFTSAYALTDVVACAIPRSGFMGLVKSDEGLSFRLIQAVCALLSEPHT